MGDIETEKNPTAVFARGQTTQEKEKHRRREREGGRERKTCRVSFEGRPFW